MSAAIKKMLADQARVKAHNFAISHREIKDHYTPTYRRLIDSIFERIDRAAPYIDEGCPDDKWPPSVRLKLLFFVVMSGPNPHHDRLALAFIERKLDTAAQRFLDGFHPDPWPDSPRQRAAA